MASEVGHITQLLDSAAEGDAGAAAELLPLVYEHLRVLARQRMMHEPIDHTLQPTALVHEAYLRLVGSTDLKWDSRGHFFGAAARAMRQILVERARRYQAAKRARRRVSVELYEVEPEWGGLSPDTLLALDEAVERLSAIDERKARIVMLRYFAGLSVDETAAALDLSRATVKRDARFARAWLVKELNLNERSEP